MLKKDIQFMTTEEYIAWKNLPESSSEENDIKYTISNGTRADGHLHSVTMKNFEALLNNIDMPFSLRQWIVMILPLHMGSSETNDLMNALECYPDYM